MSERRLVVDTNVLISRLLLPGGAAGRAVDRALETGVLLGSIDTMEELARVLGRSKFDRYVSVEERQHFLRLLGGIVKLVSVTHRVAVCRDPADDKFLHVALNGEAHVIVTGDRDLLALHPFHGMDILSPAEFLQQSVT